MITITLVSNGVQLFDKHTITLFIYLDKHGTVIISNNFDNSNTEQRREACNIVRILTISGIQTDNACHMNKHI